VFIVVVVFVMPRGLAGTIDGGVNIIRRRWKRNVA